MYILNTKDKERIPWEARPKDQDSFMKKNRIRLTSKFSKIYITRIYNSKVTKHSREEGGTMNFI